MPEVEIRPLRTISDFEGCVEIQRLIWKHPDLDITPVHQFCVSVRTGSILLGAFAGKELAGYVYSFPAVFGRKLAQHSHHLAVRAEFQGLGLGKRLKWAQRDEALARGFSLITWTYDPLQARNANLNLHTLGATGRTYFPNFYGATPALATDAGVPTDRLLLEWRIASPRVAARLSGAPPVFNPEKAPKAVERKPGGIYPDIRPKRPKLGLTDGAILVEVPKNIRDLKGRTSLVLSWQKALRSALDAYFASGFRLDDFIFGERSFYVLKKSGRS